MTMKIIIEDNRVIINDNPALEIDNYVHNIWIKDVMELSKNINNSSLENFPNVILDIGKVIYSRKGYLALQKVVDYIYKKKENEKQPSIKEIVEYLEITRTGEILIEYLYDKYYEEYLLKIDSDKRYASEFSKKEILEAKKFSRYSLSNINIYQYKACGKNFFLKKEIKKMTPEIKEYLTQYQRDFHYDE